METTTPLYVAIGNGTEEEIDSRLRGELAQFCPVRICGLCFDSLKQVAGGHRLDAVTLIR